MTTRTIDEYMHANPQAEEMLRREGFNPMLQELPASILETLDPSLFQTRDVAGADKFVDDARVEQMAEFMRNGHPMPGVVLFKMKGRYFPLDGRHRMAAYKKNESSTFWAYVIEETDEKKIHENGRRLSNQLNEINGERAGATDEEKNNRRQAVELCADEAFDLFIRGTGDEKAAITEKLAQYRFNSKSSQATSVRNIVSKKIAKNLVVKATASTNEANRLIDGMSMTYIGPAKELLARCETDKIRETAKSISIVQTRIPANQIKDIMTENKKNPVSDVVKKLQEAAGLNENNELLTQVEQTYKESYNRMNRAIASLFKELRIGTKYYGDDRAVINNSLGKLVDEADKYIASQDLT